MVLVTTTVPPNVDGLFDVRVYGAVADCVGSSGTDNGPAITAAIAAASAAVDGTAPQTVVIPPGRYRIMTSIIVKPYVRVVGYGAILVGGITGAGQITTTTTAAGPTDVAAQTAGACFTDAEVSSTPLFGAMFEGMLLYQFRYGFVSKCLAWAYSVWRNVTFESCNIGVFAYQAAQGHRLFNTISQGTDAGTTYVAASTCYPSGHPLTGLDNFFCDYFLYDNAGAATDKAADNTYFSTWFAASILRAATGSINISGTDTFGFSGTALNVTGRNIYIPMRNARQMFLPNIRAAYSENAPRGVALVDSPVNGSFENIAGETMFALGPTESMVTVLVRNSGSYTSTFRNIDGTFTTNPGNAISVIHEAGSGAGTFTNLGGVLGTIVGYGDDFRSANGRPLSYRDAVNRMTGHVAGWDLGEPSGTAAAEVLGLFPGAYVNTPTLGVTGLLTGDTNRAVTFASASSQYVSVVHGTGGPFTVGDSLTLTAWLTHTTGSAANRWFLSGQPNSYGLRMGSDDHLTFQKENVSDLATSAGVIPTGAHFVVACKNGADIRLYVDGVDVTSGVANVTLANNTGPIYIGARVTGGPTFYHNGTLDAIDIFNRALTAAEVVTLYRIGMAY